MRRWVLGLLVVALAAPATADDTAKPEAPPAYQVPFRLTEVKHIVVRARLNGKGPYHFIVDTGAPALFVSTTLCKKLGVEPGKDGWGKFDRFEIEGGVVIEKAEGKIADPFQLEGINRMGLAGVELHGVIGYNVLARYKIQLDFTQDRMTWTRLKFDPPRPEGLEGKAPGGLEAMAGMAKLMSVLLGKRGAREVRPRGFLGVELTEQSGEVAVAAVLKDSPAAGAGIQVGDRLTEVAGQKVQNVADVLKAAAGVTAGETLKLTLRRGDTPRELSVPLGKGL